MASATNIGQLLLGDVNAAKGKTGKGLGAVDGAVPGGNDVFRSFLLGGLAKSRASQQIVGDVITGKKAANADAEIITITPELIATLQNLTPESLQTLPAPLISVFAPHLTEAGTLDGTAQDMLAALASQLDGTASTESLLANKDVAALLAQFAAALKSTVATQNDNSQFAGLFDDLASKVMGTPTHVSAAKVNATGDGLMLVTDKGNITINVADLNLDQFNAFKKLAFADLAPFLTAPRTVKIDPHTLMKTVQGPSFLDDPNAPKVTFIHIANLAPSVPGASVSPYAQLTMQAGNEAAASGATPVFLDASVLARAAATLTTQKSADQALVLPQSGVAVSTGGQHPAAGRASFFAALLGIPAQGATPTPDADISVQQTIVTAQAQNPATAAPALLTQTTITAPTVQVTAASLLKGLDTSLLKADADSSDVFTAGLDSAFPMRAETASTAAAASTLLAAKNAYAGHPSTHLVSVALQRNAEGGMMGGDRQFTIQLDPENLGRVKVTLEFGENNSVKAKLVAERPETVALLQKDANALERALHNSGFDVKTDGLTFNLGGENSFQGSMSHNGNSYQNGGNQPSDDDGTDLADIHTVMPIFVDPVTGLTHVNIVV